MEFSVSSHLLEQLEMYNCKLTMQRKRLLHFLQKSRHVTPEEFLEGLKNEGLEVGLATVYRNLSKFNEIGIVRRIRLDDKYFYEINNNKHLHMVCSECGKVIEMSYPSDIELDAIRNKFGFTVSDISAEISGVCSSCCR